MNSNSVIIIGAGVGGIATATHLAHHGMRVTVIEKNRQPGGRFNRFTRDGHRFDSGPTLLIMPLVYKAEFTSLNARFDDMLNLKRVDPTYHLVFDDGSQIAITSDLDQMREQLEAIEPGSMDGYLRYLEEGHRHYEVGMSRLAERDFRSAADFFSLGNLPLLFSLKPLVPHYQHMSDFFNTERLKQAFTFQDVYMGLSPFEAPATFSMMPYAELTQGIWYPEGGMYSVVEALMEIACRAGVEFEFGTTVERIEVNGSKAKGVLLEDGRYIQSDAIVANADLPYIYNQLLPHNDYADELAHKHFSCSVVSFFWGLDKPYPELPPHTLFLANDYEANFESIIHHHGLPENPSLYIHAPTSLEPSLAPAGADSVTAIVPVGHIHETDEQNWIEIRNEARKAVFRRLALLGITDLQSHIKFEVNYTPLSWRKRYNLMKGSTHGLAHTLMQLGYMRPHNRHADYHNLYFVGASTHPGTGVPSALISARHVSDRIEDDFSN